VKPSHPNLARTILPRPRLGNHQLKKRLEVLEMKSNMRF